MHVGLFWGFFCTGVPLHLPNVDAGNLSVKLLCSKYTVNGDLQVFKKMFKKQTKNFPH